MRVITTYRVFIAAPSDMSGEVEFVVGLVADVNHLAEPLGFKFETFYWVDNATPGVDDEAQTRIDKQAAGYDVLISLMGAKIGSPTSKHSSGTIGEVEGALENFDKSFFKNDSVIALFKEVLVGIKSPNLSEIIKVQYFRDSLAKRGVLYHDFDDDEDLKNTLLASFGLLFARHIVEGSSHAGLWNRPQPGVEPDGSALETTPVSQEGPPEDPELDAEPGLFDHDDSAIDRFSRAQEEIEAIGNIIGQLGEVLPRYTKEMSDLNAAGDIAKARKVIRSVAGEIDSCAVLLEERDHSVPQLVSGAFSDIMNLVELREAYSTDLGSLDDRHKMAGVASNLASSIEEANLSFMQMKDGLLSMPRMTKELNAAKRRLLSILNKIIGMQEETLREVRLAHDYFAASRDGVLLPSQ